jgi:surface carbohydrate biosynthesis protein
MDSKRPSLIIPCESQNREFDGKLLLACFAADQGFSVIVGSKKEIHLRLSSLPRSIFLSKSLTNRNVRLYDLLGKLGHSLICGDEEALIYFSREGYLNSKVGSKAFGKAQALLAWGEENREVWESYSGYHGSPIHVTGNPRVDLLRPELRSYFDREVDELRERYGRFLLVNTNFSRMNHYYPHLSHQRRILEEPSTQSGPASEYAAGFAAHKKVLFESFLEMVGFLARTHPELTIVVRPHPSENHQPWREAAGTCKNVHVLHEGNAIPWLQAAEVMVHNGCTTAVESFLLDKQAIAYQPIRSEEYDLALANDLSHTTGDLQELDGKIREVLSGDRSVLPEQEARQRKLIHRYIASLEGPLACERIVEVVESFAADHLARAGPSAPDFLTARGRLAVRTLRKRLDAYRPGNRNSREYLRHMFPGLTIDDVRARIARIRAILRRFERVDVEQLFPDVFRVDAAPDRGPDLRINAAR